MAKVGKRRKIAIPSSKNGGLNDRCSPHFGRCSTFTVLELVDSEVLNVEKVKNPGHYRGNCIELIGILKKVGVDVLLVGGMGRIAFKVCNDLGINIYHGLGRVKVKDALDSFLNGELAPLTSDIVCNLGPGV